MPRRNVRVEIPKRNHLEMVTLTDAIMARDAELGPASPLNDPIIDMVALATQHALHIEKYNEGTEMHGMGEATTEAADIALGTNEGQSIDSPGTVYYHVGRIRNRLSLAYEAEEEQITTFGFNVVEEIVSGRKAIRIDIPIKEYLRMIELVDNIFQRHADLGPASPLNSPEIDMAALNSIHDTHIVKRKEAAAFHGKGEAAMEKARIALGIDKGQTVQTKDTVYNLVARIRDLLLIVYQSEEEELSTFGFNVVVTMTALPGETGTTITGTVNAGETVGIYDEVTDSSNFILSNTGPTELIFCRSASEGSPCDPAVGITLNPGEDTPATGLELGAAGNWLNITNTNSTVTGAFSVVVDS